MTEKSKQTKGIPLANLLYLYDTKKLWLNPEYQRESVWTLSQKQLLIDSLFRDLDIPKLYFRETDKNDYKYEVVDGQQRLRAIFEFMTDQYRLPSEADNVDGYELRSKTFENLALDLQMRLRETPLDVVIFNSGYSDEDIEEIFLRLQNGTPLNAAEKRRAIRGDMRRIVEDCSKDRVFDLCSFKNTRFAYEDVTAKILHLLFAQTITDIRPTSIRRTYESRANVSETDPVVKKLKTAFGFLSKAFKDSPPPQLKKYALITLSYLAAEMLEKYTLSKYTKEFAEVYIDFELKRRRNEELPEEQQDPKMAAYTDAARSDSIQDMQYRHNLLRDTLIKNLPRLVLKDAQRGFSDEQRMAIFWRDEGICKICKKKCDAGDFHADHITPHSHGGQTSLSNGQLLCSKCNLGKGSKEN